MSESLQYLSNCAYHNIKYQKNYEISRVTVRFNPFIWKILCGRILLKNVGNNLYTSYVVTPCQAWRVLSMLINTHIFFI